MNIYVARDYDKITDSVMIGHKNKIQNIYREENCINIFKSQDRHTDQ